MKNASECAKKLAELLKDLPEGQYPEFRDADDPVAVLILSFLMWESTTQKALAAYDRLMSRIVDFNDLRVCMPQEMVEYLGEDYPQALERSQRLRATLRNIYLREHSVSLDRLRTVGKREVKSDILAMEGIVPYVAGRVMLLCFDTHAIPADEQLCVRLASVGAVEGEVDVAEVSAWLARQIKASKGSAAHFALQAWMDGLEQMPSAIEIGEGSESDAAVDESVAEEDPGEAEKQETTAPEAM